MKEIREAIKSYDEKREAKSDEEIQVVVKVLVTEALSALLTLKTYEEQ